MVSPSYIAPAVAGLMFARDMSNGLHKRADECFNIEKSKICKGIGSANVKTVANFTNINEFDDYMSKFVDTNQYYIDGFKESYGCDNYVGQSLRYHVSSLCYYLVENSGCDQPEDYVPFCGESCNEYITSAENTFSDSDICPFTSSSDLVENRYRFNNGDYATYCRGIPSTDQCSIGIKSDVDMCGFVDKSFAQTYCDDAANTNSECCERFRNSNKSNTLAIVLGVIFGILGLILLILLIVFIVRRRRAKKLEEQQDSYYSYTNGETPINGMSNKFDNPQPMNDISKDMYYAGTPISNYNGGMTGPRDPFNNSGMQMHQPLSEAPQPYARMYSMEPQRNTAYTSTYSAAGNVYRNDSQNSNSLSDSANRQNTGSSNGNNQILSPGMQQNQANASAIAETPISGNVSLVQMKCIEAYNPVLDDEIRLAPGDIITIDEEFDDGWAVGRNESTGEIGAFPVACLVTFNDYDNMLNEGSLNFSTGRSSTYSARTKSLYKQ